MGEDPALVLPPPAAPLLGPDPAEPAPLPDGELRPAEGPGRLLGRVPVLGRLPLQQGGERRLDAVEPVGECVEQLRHVVHDRGPGTRQAVWVAAARPAARVPRGRGTRPRSWFAGRRVPLSFDGTPGVGGRRMPGKARIRDAVCRVLTLFAPLCTRRRGHPGGERGTQARENAAEIVPLTRRSRTSTKKEPGLKRLAP